MKRCVTAILRNGPEEGGGGIECEHPKRVLKVEKSFPKSWLGRMSIF
jgi:hypothetical protein